MRFLHKDNGQEGGFYLEDNGRIIGEILYTWVTDNVFAITHTEVNPDFRGEGYAKQLVDQCADFAREKNDKIIPICRYAKAVMTDNPNYSNVTVAL